jgi:hypothetical protein
VATPLLLRPRDGALPLEGDDEPPDLLNLSGDYGYLGAGYYASLDAELAGLRVWPTTAEALDAYVPPILAARARQLGLPVPAGTLVTDRFPPPPFLAWPVHPFSHKGEAILDPATLTARRTGLTYAGKYAVWCQRLPEDHRIDTVRAVLGRCSVPELEHLAVAALQRLHLPLARLRVIVSAEAYLLAAVEALPLGDLDEPERAWVEEAGTWHA